MCPSCFGNKKMTRQSWQPVVLAYVTVSSTAASVLSFAGILAGRFLYLVGLAFGHTSAFFCQDSFGFDLWLGYIYLPTVSVPPSGHRSMFCLPNATRLPANSCSVALPMAVLCRWNTSLEQASSRNNPPACPSRTRPLFMCLILSALILGVVNISQWLQEELPGAFALQENLTAARGQPKLTWLCSSGYAHPALAGAPTYCWPYNELSQQCKQAENCWFCCFVWF